MKFLFSFALRPLNYIWSTGVCAKQATFEKKNFGFVQQTTKSLEIKQILTNLLSFTWLTWNLTAHIQIEADWTLFPEAS